jgi:hypothetical protein
VKLRGFFQSECGNNSILDGITTHRHTVIFEHEGEPIAEGITTHRSPFWRIDLPIEVQDRNLRGKYGTTISDRKNINIGDAERCSYRRMRMHDRVDIWTRFHNFEMQKPFVYRLDSPFEPISIEVYRYEIVDIRVDK